jgi:hypothetical protein
MHNSEPSTTKSEAIDYDKQMQYDSHMLPIWREIQTWMLLLELEGLNLPSLVGLMQRSEACQGRVLRQRCP